MLQGRVGPAGPCLQQALPGMGRLQRALGCAQIRQQERGRLDLPVPGGKIGDGQDVQRTLPDGVHRADKFSPEAAAKPDAADFSGGKHRFALKQSVSQPVGPSFVAQIKLDAVHPLRIRPGQRNITVPQG